MPEGPPPPMPQNIGRIAVLGNNGGAPWANIFHTRLFPQTDVTFDVWRAAVVSFGQAFVEHWPSVMHDACQIERVEGRLQLPGEAQFFAESSVQAAGVHPGDSLTAQVAAVISWQMIAPAWKGGQPRTYIAGIPDQAASTPTHWAGSYLIALESAADGFLAAVNDFTHAGVDALELGVLRRVDDKEWLPVPIFHPFVGASIDSRVDTQRRRLGPT